MAEPRKWDMNPWWRGGGKRKYKIRHEIPARNINLQDWTDAVFANRVIYDSKLKAKATIHRAFTAALSRKRFSDASAAARALAELERINHRAERDFSDEHQLLLTQLKARGPDTARNVTAIHPWQKGREQGTGRPIMRHPGLRNFKRLSQPYRRDNLTNLYLEGIIEEQQERERKKAKLSNYRETTGGVVNPVFQPDPRYRPVPTIHRQPGLTWYDYAYGYTTPSGGQHFTPIDDTYNLDGEEESKFME